MREVMQGKPSGYFVVVPPVQEEGVLDLAALGTALLSAWKLLLIAALIGGVVAAAISLQMTKIYRAQAVVAPVTQGKPGAGGAIGNQLGGLAALAGIELGEAASRKEEFLATLSSDGFAREFIETEKLTPVLFDAQWDATAGKWRAGEKPPTLASAVKKFNEDVRFVTENRRTGLVTLAVEWKSPELAAAWVNRMIEMVNERLRIQATQEADKSIEYLNRELTRASVVELRQAIYRLIETQVNNAMLANVQREYAFKVIDPAVAPELRIRPKRTLLTLGGLCVGLALGVVFVLTRRVMHRRKVS
jgi:uncharacterized protein involved in exopolysaccharide biosynthesis